MAATGFEKFSENQPWSGIKKNIKLEIHRKIGNRKEKS
jgi:hypothetical protein